MAASKDRWWKNVVVYQIYPASFKDSNGDGLGDVPGIISKLDYIRDLGIDAIWVSPIYDSPQIDMGYDIRNYEAIYEPYGTVNDVTRLINEAHERGMRILMDLVINHTSDQHEWFKESRSSKNNPKRDWYIWRPARYDENGNRFPPNNWRSCFSQSAWAWDELTQEYYLHLFAVEQPDLNWENPLTRRAIYDTAIEFWLKIGVDGFRVDTVNLYSKWDLEDVEVVDHKVYHQPASHKYCNGPRMHEFLREMNEVFAKYGDIMTVGESVLTHSTEEVLSYVSESDPQLSMVFQFEVVDVGTGFSEGKPKFEHTPWNLSTFKKLWTKMQQILEGTDGWSTVFLENHDQARSVSRFATDAPAHRNMAAKMLATTLTTLTGTLFVYQGQEIGMINAPASWGLEKYKDIDSINHINLVRETEGDDPKVTERLQKGLQALARDHSRLPMHWDATKYAGFSSGENDKPWMPVHDVYPEINVLRQQGDPESVLNFWKKMLRLRKQYANVFAHGTFRALDLDNEKTFVYLKRGQDSATALVALNYTGNEQPFPHVEINKDEYTCLVCTYRDSPGFDEPLRPWEARVYINSF